MDLPGPYYNTNAQVSVLERLVKRLPEVADPTPAPSLARRTRTAKQLNAEQTAALIAGYQAGATLRDLGAQFGIHPDTASLILRRNGVAMRPKGLRSGQEAEAVLQYASGLSLKRVGALLAVDGETVRQELIRQGVPLRDRHGRPQNP